MIARLASVSQKQVIMAAAGGSLGLLAGAFMFQALGYAPCQMCLWQRWPHAAAIVLGGLALSGLGGRAVVTLAWLGALAALVTAGLGGFHAGVEQGWWDGPSACSGGAADLGALSASDLVSTAIQDTVVMCNEIAWSMFGISMAAWNMIFSLGFMGLWITAARMT